MLWKKILSRDYSVQYCEVALHALSKRVHNMLGEAAMQRALIVPQHKNQCFYFEKNEERLFLQFIIKHYASDKATFEAFVELFKKIGETYRTTCKVISQQPLKTYSREKLKKKFLRYQDIALEYTCIIWITYLVNEYWTAWGSKKVAHQDDLVKEALFRPIKKSTVLHMQEEAALLKKNPKNIRAFWKKYQWLPCLDLQNNPWTLEEVQDYIKHLKPVAPQQRIDFFDAAAKANLSEEDTKKFTMIQTLGYIKDARDDYRRQGIYAIRTLFNEIAQRMNISMKDVAYLTEKEILSFLSGETVELTNTKKRQNGFLLYYDTGGNVVCTHQAITKHLEQFGFREESSQQRDVQGISAFPGKVRGPVTLVRTVHDILKVQKDDILVAVTTHPDYVPAMQKAAAIVTDEGGRLSHAAIVSRELGIPCIVGTQNATKRLSQGSQVEVDATRGIVRRLAKRNLNYLNRGNLQ